MDTEFGQNFVSMRDVSAMSFTINGMAAVFNQLHTKNTAILFFDITKRKKQIVIVQLKQKLIETLPM